MPGMPLYTTEFLTRRTGKEDAHYDSDCAEFLEAPFFLDAVHHVSFPFLSCGQGRSIVSKPSGGLRQVENRCPMQKKDN